MFNNVSAFNFTGTFFKGFGAGNGSHLTWLHPFIVSTASTAVAFDDTAVGGFDNLTIDDGWFEMASAAGFKAACGRFTMRATRLVPYTQANSTWFLFTSPYGSHVSFEDTDFGGESGRQMLQWNSPNGDLTFFSCGLFGIAGSTGIQLTQAPTTIAFTSCSMSGNPTSLLYIDPAITASNLDSLMATQIWIDGCPEYFRGSVLANYNDNNSVSLAAKDATYRQKAFVQVSDLVAISGMNWQSSGGASNVTQANSVTDPLGGGTYNYQFTATGANAYGYANMNGGPGIAGITNGNYTAECVVFVSVGTATVQFSFGGKSKCFNLGYGVHHLCLPVNLVTNSPRAIGFQINLSNGSVVSIGQFKVFKGLYDKRDWEVRGSTAPTSGSYNWEKGNRVVNNTPTVGQPKSWVCTASGAPGTWVSEGNL